MPERKRSFANIVNLAQRNPLTISPWVLLWASIGIVCGLFAACYWLILEAIIHQLENFTGLSLLLVMPVGSLFVGLVIYFLGNSGEIGLLVDNIHFRGGKPNARQSNSSKKLRQIKVLQTIHNLGLPNNL